MRSKENRQAADTAERDLAYKIAQVVHDSRTSLGWSQTQLAKRAGMRQPHVSRLEGASSLPTLEVLRRVADAMGMELVVTFAPRTEGNSTAVPEAQNERSTIS